MDLGLDGKLAVISGGSVGIGLAAARTLAREGARVLIAARDGARAADEAARIRADFGRDAQAVAADVTTAEGCAAVVAAAAGMGGAELLFNNAGTGSNETILDAPDEKWLHYWNLHVMAAVRLARGLVPQMQAHGGGAILNNASICAVQPLWYEPIYNTTKAALMMLSKTMSTEFIPLGIRVNTLNPGLILTPDWIKTAKALARDGDWQGYLQSVADEHAPIRRFGTPEELADIIAFLLSPRASYCTGSTYHVDGGMLKTV
ncbi:SDR family NAD(P)-dependent oxidoreductase [Tabrizicola flagellatus]|uniref:SDR family NAD(P)-dependent oxidoreductase n=1 Tax=Tabrizicola flagellatus TaxID=2593021 RepID=UPI0011F27043|nr:SDR family oxidoreductase [Tabrizicola flagellatus]